MAQVSVTIDNRKYRVACNEGEEERLAQLAAMIDGKIAELRASFGEIGDQRLVVMAALTIADNLTEAREQLAAEQERNRAALARSEEAAANLDALGARLEALAERLSGGAEA
jgi:cell division protein ZapA